MESKIIHGDCIDEMQQMEENSVDLIVTDPPYFLPANHYQTRKQFSRNFGDLGILEHFFKDVFKEMVRVLKPTGRLYIFCDGQSYPLFYYHLYPYCKSVRPLIWDKKTSINGYSWRHQHYGSGFDNLWARGYYCGSAGHVSQEQEGKSVFEYDVFNCPQHLKGQLKIGDFSA